MKMRSRSLAILFGSTIVIAAIAYGVTVFSSPQNVTRGPEEIMLYDEFKTANPHPVRVTDMVPNSIGFFMYPRSFNITDNADAYQRFMLIRLPTWMGGGNDTLDSFRAYSAVGLSDQCIVKYSAIQERWRIEDPCSGDMYRAVDGYLYQKEGNGILLQDNIALPRLDLVVDSRGYIAVAPPVFAQDKNGVIGIGRSLPQDEVDRNTAFMKKMQEIEGEAKFHAPLKLTTGEYATTLNGDWYSGAVGYQPPGKVTYYPLVTYQFCNCSDHDHVTSQKSDENSGTYWLGRNLVIATPTVVSANGTKYDYRFDFYMDPYLVEVVTTMPLDKGLKMVSDNFLNATSNR